LIVLEVPADYAGGRLDHFLCGALPEFSRSRLQTWIKSGRVLVSGSAGKSAMTLRGGETIEIHPAELPALRAFPEEIDVEVLYEDDAVAAVNKPAGMVVHPGAGNDRGTLVNALLHRFGRLSKAGGEDRPGIVHRLDRETSGVMLVARNDAAHRDLAAQFAGRTVEKHYLALARGVLKAESGRIERPIARDPSNRLRMTAKLGAGRAAVSEYRVRRRFEKFTLLDVRILTGRTHQIRAHLSAIGHPLAGDPLYGGPRLEGLNRVFLHSAWIEFTSPAAKKRVRVEAPLPENLEAVLARLL
jgi:23S rRNA pseudouridine1911/1915/1917 synthase